MDRVDLLEWVLAVVVFVFWRALALEGVLKSPPQNQGVESR